MKDVGNFSIKNFVRSKKKKVVKTFEGKRNGGVHDILCEKTTVGPRMLDFFCIGVTVVFFCFGGGLFDSRGNIHVLDQKVFSFTNIGDVGC